MIDWLAAGVMGDKSLKMCRISTNLGFFVSRFFLQIIMSEKDKNKLVSTEKRKADECEPVKDLKKVSSGRVSAIIHNFNSLK